MLKAKLIFSFSAQFNLNIILKSQDDIHKNTILNDFIKDTTIDINMVNHQDSTIIYMFPLLCDQDYEQSQIVRQLSNVLLFPVKSDIHGDTINKEDLIAFLNLSVIKLKKMAAVVKSIGFRKTLYSNVPSNTDKMTHL